VQTRIHENELEWWLGNITNVNAKSFTAVLEDLSGRRSKVEFDINSIEDTDRELIFEGSILTYSISSYHDPSRGHGGMKYVTKLAFSGKRKWYQNYESKAVELVNDLFPSEIYAQ